MAKVVYWLEVFWPGWQDPSLTNKNTMGQNMFKVSLESLLFSNISQLLTDWKIRKSLLKLLYHKKSNVDFINSQASLWRSLSWRQKRLFVIINFEPQCKVLSLSHRSFKRWLKKEKKTNTLFFFAKKHNLSPNILIITLRPWSYFSLYIPMLCLMCGKYIDKWPAHFLASSWMFSPHC